MKVLSWEACLNVRDVGGYPTQDGRQIRLGALVRADNLHNLTASGRVALEDYGVRTIIDLRYPGELKRLPNPFADPAVRDGNVRYLNLLPLDEGGPAGESALQKELTIEARYRFALDVGRVHHAKIATAIAEAPDGGVLVHCHAGRDRTGRLVALLLNLAGVPRETIVEDYVLSDTYLQPLYEKFLNSEQYPKERQELNQQIAEAPELMENVLSYLEKRYGGAEGYLRGGGMTDEKMEKLRTRVVD